MHDREMVRALSDGLDRFFHRQCETQAKLWAYPLVPCLGLLQFCIRFGKSYNRERHCFLNNPAFTCSHGITSEGFCS
jgi:hypothetical protein